MTIPLSTDESPLDTVSDLAIYVPETARQRALRLPEILLIIFEILSSDAMITAYCSDSDRQINRATTIAISLSSAIAVNKTWHDLILPLIWAEKIPFDHFVAIPSERKKLVASIAKGLSFGDQEGKAPKNILALMRKSTVLDFPRVVRANIWAINWDCDYIEFPCSLLSEQLQELTMAVTCAPALFPVEILVKYVSVIEASKPFFSFIIYIR
jgi:hypothetical protein